MGTVLLICGYLFIAIAVIFLITVLKRVIKKGKFTARDRAVPIVILGVGFLYVIALVFHYSGEIEASERIQILLMFGLVAVTSFYAWSASRQADASTEMAEEMKEQRYDSVRPLIDIRRIEHGESWAESQALLTEQRKEAYGDYSQGLSCRLHNIGVGPATDVYSFVQTPDGKCQLLPFGALAEDGKTDKYRLSLKQSDNRTVLIAYYRDIYDNCFESSREVIKGKVHLGQLKIRKIPKEEFPK